MAKKTFNVEQGESINDCLARIEAAGYRPTRRMERPVFKEDKDGNVTLSHQDIVFEAKPHKSS